PGSADCSGSRRIMDGPPPAPTRPTRHARRKPVGLDCPSPGCVRPAATNCLDSSHPVAGGSTSVNDEKPPRDGGQTGGEAAGHTGVLRETLRAARNLLRKITGDPLLVRLLDVYSRTPAEDREVLIGVLEREVTWRRMS